MQTQAYSDFWQKVHRSAKRKGFPLRVMFELTYRCNFYCRHCYVPFSYRRKKELKTKEVFLILDQLAKMRCLYLGFTGGEPFMRRDILQVLRYAKQKGFLVMVYTNGSLIDEAKVKALAKLKLNKVDITIPAMTVKAFRKISRLKGAHEKVFHAIRLLAKYNVPLGFKTCVLKENQEEITQIQEFCHCLGAQHRLDNLLSRRLNGSAEPYLYRGTWQGNQDSKKSKEECAAEN